MRAYATFVLASSMVVLGGGAAAAQQARGPTGTLIVSNMNDNTATLLDAATGRTLATLPTGTGPHEVTVSHDGRWALVSNYGVRAEPGSTITVIDVPARIVARTITLGDYKRPHGMAFLPGDTTFLVTSEMSRAVLLVGFADGQVRRVIQSGGRATHMLGVSRDGRHLVTANIADGTISHMDLFSDDIPRTVQVLRQPEGIAIAPDGRSAWVGSNRDSAVVVVNLERGVATDTLRGFGLPYRIAISADGRRAVITDPMLANVHVVDAATRRPIATIDIPRDSLVPTAEVPGSPSPEGVTIAPGGSYAYVTLQGRNRVAIIDLDRARIVRTGVTGTWSDGIGYSVIAPRP